MSDLMRLHENEDAGLDWLFACDDCLDGFHHRCRRRRKCACHACAWQKRLPAPPPPPKPKKKPKKRCGRVSEKHDYTPITDELCLKAAELLAAGLGIGEIAETVNIERTNLHRALQRRGLR